ncbi:MAG: YcxB family protein [Ruminiclostridium sp.]|nr:YcxB family protein [Ruminiclostridium sp.]
MTEFSMTPSRECVGEYLNRSIHGAKGQKALLYTLYGVLGLFVIAGIVAAILLGQPILIGISVLSVVTGVAYPFLIRFALKGSADQLVASMKENSEVNAAVCEANLIFVQGGVPKGLLEWADVTKIDEGKTGFFLKTSKDSLLILAKDSVVSGTYDEAAQILRAKRESLTNSPKKEETKK